MKCGHLFNGIGGFALAAHWMGWTNVFHCEIDDFCNKVMNKHFPNSIQHGNIKEQDFTGYRGTIDLITGGFPCQPYSNAGKRKGKEDERHLWPEMLRAIREIQPGWVVGENVRGLTNWNGGVVFDEVQADLEAEGYKVLPFLLPAACVNAPHRRYRIWPVAYSEVRDRDLSEGSRNGQKEMDVIGNGTTRSVANAYGNDASGYRHGETGCTQGEMQNEQEERKRIRALTERISEEGVTTDTQIFKEREQADEINALAEGRETWFEFSGNSNRWDGFPAQSPVCGRNDGVPDRMDRIAALGNAIVPQVAYQIFKAIEQYNKLTQ